MDVQESIPEEPKLRISQKFAYGLGHILNDMVSTMWFSYLILYFSLVINLSPTHAGFLILFGQIVDALVTPILGIEFEKTPFLRYGRRKSWHLAGTVMVLISFPFLFSPCPFVPLTFSLSGDNAYFFYYIPFVFIFQTGWAIVQISHLALINDLGITSGDRLTLNSIRCSSTALASLFSYMIVWAFLGIRNGDINYTDLGSFQNIAVTIALCGIFFSLTFHGMLQEYTGDIRSLFSPNQDPSLPLVSWKSWISFPEFYIIGINYMLIRVAFNCTQVYINFYIIDTLHLESEYIARIPCVNFVFSCLLSLIIGPLIPQRFHNVILFVNQAGLILLGIWLKFIGVGLNHSIPAQVYVMYSMFGVITSFNLIISITMVTNMINKRTKSDAFVFGAMSFCDKLLNGIVIFAIQRLATTIKELEEETKLQLRGPFYRNIMFRLILSVAVLSILNHIVYVVYRSSLPPEFDEENEHPSLILANQQPVDS